MNRAPLAIDADALNAYADGQLGDTERASVEAYLAAHPDAAADVARWRRQNEALTALFGPIAKEAVPQRLSPQRIAQNIRASQQHQLVNIAAAVVLVILGSGIGWYGRDYLLPSEAASERLIDDAVTAHTLYVKEQTHAVEVAAGAPNLMRWLSNRIATQIDAPDLSGQGFTFLGARLLPGDHDANDNGAAAQLMYQNASAQRLTLFITAALPDKKEVWHFESRDGVEAYYWANGLVTCTIVSDMPEADVRALGKTVFEQLTRRPDSTWNPAS